MLHMRGRKVRTMPDPLEIEDLIKLYQIAQSDHLENAKPTEYDRLFASCLIKLHEHITAAHEKGE